MKNNNGLYIEVNYNVKIKRQVLKEDSVVCCSSRSRSSSSNRSRSSSSKIYK